MVIMNPVLIAYRKRIAQLLSQKLLEIDPVCAVTDAFPELQHFLHMLVDLIASRSAIVNDTFLKERTAHGKGLSAELRRYDAALPVEIHIRQIDAGHAFVLVGAENTLIINGNKAFKLRPELPDIPGQILQDVDTLGSADGEDDDIAELRAVIPVEISHIAETVNQRLAAGNNIADHQSAVRHHGQLAVLDLQSRDLLIFKDTLTGQEADVMNTDVLPVTALLQRIVESASQNRKNIGSGHLLLLLQIIKHLGCGGNQTVIHLIAYNLRRIQKLSGLRL